jgi:PAS domain S-box-containing protein
MKNKTPVKTAKKKKKSSKISLSPSQKKIKKTIRKKTSLKASGVKRVIKPIIENSSDIYRDIIENIREGIFEVDLKGHFTFVNDAVCRATGLTKKKLIGMSSRPFTDKDDDKKVMRAYGSVYKTGMPFEGLGWHIIRKNGEKRYIEGSIYLRKDPKGKPIGFRVIATDATERKKTEDAYRIASLEWQVTFNTVNDAICLLNTDQRIIRSNTTMNKMFGLSQKEMTGKHCWTVIHGTKKPIPECPIIKSKKSLKQEEIELKVKNKWLHVVVYPLLQDKKIIIGYVHIVRDITQRKQAEESALKEYDFNRTVFDSLSVPFFMIDTANWHFVRWNKIFPDLIGYSDEELAKFRPRNIIPKSEIGTLIKAQDKLLANGHVSFEMPLVSKDQTVTPYLLSGTLLNYYGKSYLIGIGINLTERKKSEEALKEAEYKFRTIFDHASDGILLARSSDKKFIEANEIICRMLGYTKDELLQFSISDIHPKDSLSNVVEQFIKLFKKEISVVHELPVIKKDKSVFFVDVTASAIDYKGTECLLGMFRDVTDRKKAEEELKESRESYRRLFEDHAAVKLIIDPQNGEILDANHAACQYYGWTSEKMRQMKISDINTLTPEEVKKEMEKARDQKRFHFEFKHRLANGSIRDVEVYSSTIEMNGKSVLHSIVHDVTERKKFEKDLKKSEMMFRRLFENSPVGVFLLKDRILVDVNPAICAITGYQREELIGQSVVIGYKDQEEFERVGKFAYEDVAKWGTGVSEARLKRKNGELYDGLLYISLIDPHDASSGHQVIMIDITARKQAEEKLAQSREDYRKLFEDHSAVKLVIDPSNGMILDANHASAEYYGWTREEMRKMKMEKLTSSTAEEIDERMKEILLNKKLHFEASHRLADGSIRDVEVFSSRIEMMGKDVIHSVIHDITERKQAEAEIVVLSNALKVTLDPILILDLEGKVINANEAAKRLVETEDLGVSALDYVAPEDKEKVTTIMQQLLMGSDVHTADFTLITKSGRRMLIEATGNLIVDSNGKATGFVVVERDVTERKRAEEDLRASEEKFALAFKHSPTAMCITSLEEGRYIDANDAYLTNLGYKREEIIGRTIMDINLWVDLSEPKEFIKELFKTGKATNYELRVRDKKGMIHWGLASASMIKLSEQICVLTQIMDITEQKLAEEKIRTEEQRFRGITQNLPGVIYQFYAKDTGEYSISYISEPMNEFAEIMSKSELENLNLAFSDFCSRIHEDDQQRFFISIKEAVETVSRWNFEGRIATKTGKMVWFQGMSIPTRLEDRVVFDGIILSITDRKIAEEAALKEYNFSNTVLETLPAPFYMFDYETVHFFRWNKNFSAAAGYSDEELIHMTPFDLVSKSEHNVLVKAFEEVFTKGNVISEMTIVSKDGSITPYLLSGNMLNYEGKLYVIGMGISLAERKKAEEALRAEEERFRIITEQSSDIIILVNRDGKIIYENPSIEKILGYNFQDRKGQNAFENVHPDDLPFFLNLFEMIMKDEKLPVEKTEVRIRHADGTWRTFEVVGGTLKMNNIIEMVIANLRDITERKKAEEKLRESEEKYRGIFDESITAIYIFDTKKYFIDSNQAGLDLLGYSREELIKMSIPDVDADPVVVLPAHQEILAGGRLINYEHRLRRKDGRIITVLNNSIPLTDTEGNTIGMLSTLIDITERRHAEEKLMLEEKRFRSLADYSLDIIILLNTKGVVTYINPTIEKTLGYKVEERIGQYGLEHVHPDDLEPAVHRFMILATDTNSPVLQAEMRVQHKDGSWRLFETVGSNLVKDNTVETIIIRQHDITDRKRVEKSLRESEEKFRILTESTPTAVMLYQNDKWIYANPAATEISGYSNEELLRLNFWDFVHPDDRQTTIERGQKRQKGESVTNRYTLRIIAKDGTVKWIDLSGATITIGGSPAGIVSVMDITERKNAEEKLRREEQLFRSLTEQSSDLITIVNSDAKIIYHNPAVEKVLGYKPGERFGQSGFDLVHPDDLEMVMDAYKTLFSDVNAPVQKGDVRYRHKDGSWRTFEVAGSNLVDHDVIEAAIVNMHDITERKKAEEALKESESNLKYAQEEAHVGSWEYDALQQKPFWSDEMFRIVGRDPALGPMSLEDFVELVHPDERKRVYRDVAKCFTKNLPYYHEYRIFKPDNKIAFIESRGKAITDDKGNILRISGILQDVTERKQTEETLTLIKKAVESSSDAIGMSDPQGHHFYHNKAFTELFEYTAEELEAVGGGPAVYVNKDVAREVFETIMNGGSWNGELEMISKSGRKLTVLLRADAIIDENGKLIGLIGVHTDMTESKKAEEELRRIQLLNEAILETVPGILYLYDDTGQLVHWNKQHETLTGYSSDEMRGRFIMDWFGGVEPDTSDIKKGIAETMTRGYGTAEGHLLTKDGNAIFMFFTGVKLKIDGKDHLLGIGVDITERKKAEEEIIRLNETLEQRVKERTTELEAFSYSVSHDLRAPLRSIHGFGQALLEDYENQLNEEAKGYLGRITRATDTMSDLIEDMLKLSRISRAEMDILPINLSQIVQSIVDELCKSQPERRVEIKIADDMQDLADPRLIRIAFENLLSNSWKFTVKNDNARIEFGLTLKDGKKEYFIRDNGAGFDMEYADKLFTPFQRYHNAEEYAGTGIGLAIVKRIIIRHGGRIWADSKIGEGTTIYFMLEE